jgi:predicted nucleic acid-binding Zn ribbon protein
MTDKQPIHAYKCPNCGKEHGALYYNFDDPYSVLCDECLNSELTDPILRIHTLIFYVNQLRTSIEDIGNISNGFRMM